MADPSQQLAFGEGEMIRELVDGAAYLFSNEYESHLIESKTGWTADEILERVGTQVITLGPDGVRIVGRDQEKVEVPAVPGVAAVEPTGVGDAFRSGFLAALEWRLPARAGGAGRLRARGVRRGAGRHAGVHLHRPSSSWPGSPGPTATRPRPRCGRTSSASPIRRTT